MLLFGLLILGILIVIGMFSHQAEQNRRKDLAQFATLNGLSYSPEKVLQFDERFREFSFLHKGTRRYARHCMHGQLAGGNFLICEYHYQVNHHHGKNRRSQHYLSTLIMCHPPFNLKPLLIRPEGMMDKLKSSVGGYDISFSSEAFSKQFHVTSPDREWAYAVLQPQTIDLLLQRPNNLEYHMQHGWLCLRQKKGLNQQSLASLIHLAQTIIENIPDPYKVNQ
ncbi:hypothetical protein P3T73_11765 [Kiritimatiellota bacterium B12222]|nr:hypothetical protein P3T73_11765 [Kiritimatiellota bacterium B12222]